MLRVPEAPHRQLCALHVVGFPDVHAVYVELSVHEVNQVPSHDEPQELRSTEKRGDEPRK